MGKIEYAYISLGDNPYVDDASEALACVFDIGVNTCGLSGNDLSNAFVASGMARNFEKNNPVYVAGKSGTELLMMLVAYMGLSKEIPHEPRYERSREYWLGWILPQYQACTGRQYRTVFSAVGYERLLSMYYPLHEAPEQKTFDLIEGIINESQKVTKLQRMRVAAGLSQRELSNISGVGLRSIQMYEQRNKNIDNAAVSSLLRLSLALHCEVEDLIEAL